MGVCLCMHVDRCEFVCLCECGFRCVGVGEGEF